jgi:hypothetical protein
MLSDDTCWTQPNCVETIFRFSLLKWKNEDVLCGLMSPMIGRQYRAFGGVVRLLTGSRNIRNNLSSLSGGPLRAEGFAGSNRLYEKGVIVEAACWTHVRRKFHNLYEAHASLISRDALERIAV